MRGIAEPVEHLAGHGEHESSHGGVGISIVEGPTARSSQMRAFLSANLVISCSATATTASSVRTGSRRDDHR